MQRQQKYLEKASLFFFLRQFNIVNFVFVQISIFVGPWQISLDNSASFSEYIFEKGQLAEKEKADKRHQLLVLRFHLLKAARYIHPGDLQKDSKFAKAFQALATMVPLGVTLVPLRRLDFSLSDRLLAKFGPKKWIKIQLMKI